ncbi:MAG: CHASE3 domain-containing protein [Pseudomonadota bacterium]
MKKVLRSGIDRRYVLLPLLVGIVLVLSIYFVQQVARDHTRNLTVTLRDREDRMRQIDELIYTSVAAESAQRGFLLTADPAYLPPYASGRAATAALLDKLIPRYQQRDQSEVPVLEAVKATLATKYDEMDRNIEVVQNGRGKAAMDPVVANVGLTTLEVRQDMEALRARERARVYDGISRWNGEVRLHAAMNLGSMIFTLLLLAAVGLLTTSEIKRRNLATKELQLEVSLRTAELRELSEHMLRIGEVEKSALARELHDELGGLLVAMRMDFSQLRRKIVLPDAVAEERWERIDKGLKMGVELKRRVIEGLRPTLLDNMGLVVALRWQAEETCQQGNIKLTTELPEKEPELGSDAVIAVFRTVQEAFSNVLKHARATEVRLAMASEDDNVTITVEDNGVGLPAGASQRAGSHGLKQMRFRMQAIRGSSEVKNGPAGGSITTIRFPIAGNMRSNAGVG